MNHENKYSAIGRCMDELVDKGFNPFFNFGCFHYDLGVMDGDLNVVFHNSFIHIWIPNKGFKRDIN